MINSTSVKLVSNSCGFPLNISLKVYFNIQLRDANWNWSPKYCGCLSETIHLKVHTMLDIVWFIFFWSLIQITNEKYNEHSMRWISFLPLIIWCNVHGKLYQRLNVVAHFPFCVMHISYALSKLINNKTHKHTHTRR